LEPMTTSNREWRKVWKKSMANRTANESAHCQFNIKRS
jgi:hypothetical protein